MNESSINVEIDRKADNDLLDALGGTVVVSEICGVTPSAISQWRKNGIPPGWKRTLEAERRKRSTPPEFDDYQRMALQILEKLGPEERAEWFREGVKLEQQRQLKEEVEALKAALAGPAGRVANGNGG